MYHTFPAASRWTSTTTMSRTNAATMSRAPPTTMCGASPTTDRRRPHPRRHIRSIFVFFGEIGVDIDFLECFKFEVNLFAVVF